MNELTSASSFKSNVVSRLPSASRGTPWSGHSVNQKCFMDREMPVCVVVVVVVSNKIVECAHPSLSLSIRKAHLLSPYTYNCSMNARAIHTCLAQRQCGDLAVRHPRFRFRLDGNACRYGGRGSGPCDGMGRITKYTSELHTCRRNSYVSSEFIRVSIKKGRLR